MAQRGKLLGIRSSLEGREHVGDGEVPGLADIPREGQGVDRPYLHIPRALSTRLFSGFPVEDQVKDLQIRMGRGDHLKGGGLPDMAPRPHMFVGYGPCQQIFFRL